MSISSGLVLTAIVITVVTIIAATVASNISPTRWGTAEEWETFTRYRNIIPLLFMASVLFWLGAIWTGVAA